MKLRQSISILRCSAGGVSLGLAAEEVLEFRVNDFGSPHLGVLLGLMNEPPPFATTTMLLGEQREQKTLRLRSGERAALVGVDGPLSLRAIGPADVLPLPKLLREGRISPVIGFAEEEGDVVLLLDVLSIIHLARVARFTETRTRS